MAIIIRRISEHGTVLDRQAGPEVSVGRATDNTIELPGLLVALHHLRLIAVSAVALRAKCVSGADISVNGKPGQRTADLVAGDEIGVGPHRIRVGVISAEGPLLLEVTEQSGAASTRSERGAMSLAEAGWRQRRWAYWGVGAVLSLALLFPLLLRMVPATTDLGRWLPTDRLWSSGRISNAHLGFGHECGACHVALFERVQDQACMACHDEVPAHSDDIDTLHQAGLDERTCASCHFEHSGPAGMISQHDGLCVDCHGRPQEYSTLVLSAAIADFHQSHPVFQVEVNLRDARQDQTLRTNLGPDTRDQTGLIFPHDLHLVDDGLRGPDGLTRLECGACHVQERGGLGFAPPRFEAHCQDCHQLDVDFAGSLVQLPHGDSDLVRASLVAALALAKERPPTERDASDSSDSRRRPGEQADRGEASPLINSIDEVFERRVCGKCHDVVRDPDVPARVRAPHLRDSWMVYARFDHQPHRAVNCASCHDAEASDDSDHLLLPQIDTCRTCHASIESAQQFETACVDCHRFHGGGIAHAGTVTGVRAGEPGSQKIQPPAN